MAMTDEIDNLLLEHLKALRNELRDFRNEFHSETDNLKHRMSSLETAMVNVKREVNAGDETDARHQVQLDQLAERIRRLEKRLELS
jgi:archaellum component FlaC